VHRLRLPVSAQMSSMRCKFLGLREMAFQTSRHRWHFFSTESWRDAKDRWCKLEPTDCDRGTLSSPASDRSTGASTWDLSPSESASSRSRTKAARGLESTSRQSEQSIATLTQEANAALVGSGYNGPARDLLGIVGMKYNEVEGAKTEP
jgi:hypothetical protein